MTSRREKIHIFFENFLSDLKKLTYTTVKKVSNETLPEDFKVSRERIRQIEEKALKKLRKDDDPPPDDLA